MTTNATETRSTELDLQQFIDSIPSSDAIRARMDQNFDEAAVLKRLLRLAVAAERERASRVEAGTDS
jgi:hypothetical protein